MKLEGIHHITCITGDAPANVEFYVGVLGLRLVKKSVNQDDPTVYHLFYADEKGSAGSDITFFEYPGARPGRAGAGMIHTITWRVGSQEGLDFWEERLAAHDVETVREGGRLRFQDPEGLGLELAVVETEDPPLVAEHPEIPAVFALQGFDSVRAYSQAPDASRSLLEETLGFERRGESEWEVRGDQRGGLYAYDEPPAEPGEAARERSTTLPGRARSMITRPGGTASLAPGRGRRRSSTATTSGRSTSASRAASSSRSRRSGPASPPTSRSRALGERLALPPDYEPLRDRLEDVLTPLPDPRAAWTTK